MRGAAVEGVRPHLLSALAHADRAVLGQLAVPDKGSEIPALKELLEPMDLTGTVITADALHCTAGHRDLADQTRGRRRDDGQGQPVRHEAL
ncbi:hypothetical protein BN12_4030001 [Nostocoides japonicum T1-X7]|uniref:Transposase IS4-like domain-containing protein n=2 Tax=Nostocoides japonicum TaxID=99481 RepID=A0A077LZV8_9MICO|nr:hypothetical protein BN12_4030001 [Tetrasphaera japonica T1-X7]